MQSDAIFKEFVVISQSIYVGKVFYWSICGLVRTLCFRILIKRMPFMSRMPYIVVMPTVDGAAGVYISDDLGFQ